MAPPRNVLFSLAYNTIVIGKRVIRGRVYWRVEGPHELFPRASLTHYALGPSVFEIQRARVLMTLHLERPLDATEIVHHKDHNSFNDALDNLELISIEDHNKHHHIGLTHTEETKRQIGRSVSRTKGGKYATFY
jgi:hypothetical protein